MEFWGLGLEFREFSRNKNFSFASRYINHASHFMIYLARIFNFRRWPSDSVDQTFGNSTQRRLSMIKKFLTLIISFGTLCILPQSAFAVGDAVAGKEKTAACVACHGEDGNGVAPDFPKIAGQIPGYIASQLAAYKSGERPSAVMMGMIVTLTEQDMQDIDAYYSQFEFTKQSIDESELVAANRGREIYRRGLSQFSVPSCMACHGPSGDGIPSRYPKISGQYKTYLVNSLLEFKSGIRKNEEMNTIAFRLSEQQIQDLATYLYGLD